MTPDESAIVRVEELQEEVPCPLCGECAHDLVMHACDRLFARPGQYRVVACRACGLRYVSPRPTLAALGTHYPDDYFIYRTPEELPALTRPVARWFSRMRWTDSVRRVERVLGRLEPELRVVDVGCGLNDFLVTLRELRGIRGVGVDFKPEAAEYARDRLGMPVHAGTLHDARFAAASFDLITMYEYLEHEPNPRDVLAEARRIAAPGGHLCIEVPYPDGLPARVFGTRWSQVDAPRHLLHFSEHTLAELLRRTGFELVHTETFSIPYVIGFSVLQAFGHRRLGYLSVRDRALAMLVSMPFMAVAPWIDEFRFALARAV